MLACGRIPRWIPGGPGLGFPRVTAAPLASARERGLLRVTARTLTPPAREVGRVPTTHGSRKTDVSDHSAAERGLSTPRRKRDGSRPVRTDIGRVVPFAGICRGTEAGAPVAALTLEHYPGMPRAEIARHVGRSAGALAAHGRHRHPTVTRRMVPGDNIVLVVTAASPPWRRLRGGRILMDYLKTKAPFWKHEERPDGTSWVAAKDTDDAAAGRWDKPRHAAE